MFIHLRLHTEFSVVDGTNRIDDVIDVAAEDRQPALAITDLNNLFGAVKFYKGARKKGIKPIIGAEVMLEPMDGAADGPSRVLVLVQNTAGYLNLCEILTRAWTRNVQNERAVCKLEWLQELHEGLILLSGAQAGPVGKALARNEWESAERIAGLLCASFPGRFYLELQRAGRVSDEIAVTHSVQLAVKLRLPVVATHPVQFPTREDYDAHEARICIADSDVLGNAKRVRRFTPEQYFKSSDEMTALFADIPSAIENAINIAKRCSLTLVLGQSRLPDFPTPLVDGKQLSPDEYFRHASFEGLEERLAHRFPHHATRDLERPRYVERLEFELATIIKMGFPGYFLIVGDFINWAKKNGCPVGPGRGSGAGSLVAYALKITDLDPLLYNLLFERFLNPERVSMPDFDIDFCQSNRDRVIDYVKLKYGRDAVSQIATFGTMAARGVVRDVGRVMEMSYGFCDGISKLIPNKPGTSVTLQLPPTDGSKSDKYIYATEAEPILAQREEAEEEVKNLLAMSRKLEGLTRNIGMHAGGVLIAPGKLTDFCPLYQQPGSTSAVSQYDKDDVEAIGLVKFDFLGLATLTILEIAKEFIMLRHADQQAFAYENLPLDDADVYQLFSEGKTEAVFQFESRGMQAMLKDARPTRLEDLFALNAMFRPGPMENIPDFCARKNGRTKVVYPHPLLEQVMSETYGIMVYQEQVMQAAQVMGGYSLGGADMLRRAMGKKKPEEMAQHRVIFREGAAKNGIGADKADEVFSLMEKFAGYGFNKSHAAAYSLLAYHTAWIKVHYTAEFYCANMTVEMGDTDKLKILYEDAKRMGITTKPPDINRSQLRFHPLSDSVILYGLGAVKGAGAQAVESIVAAREGRGDGPHGEEAGPFKSLFDFCRRVNRKSLNKRTIEALIKAGAFDSISPNRAALAASVQMAIDHGAAAQANVHQGGLFDLEADGSAASEPDLLEAEPWGGREGLLHEKTAIGFCLSGHLFDEPAVEIRQFAPTTIADLVETREPVMVAGIVSDLRVLNGRRGKTGVFLLDDKSAVIDAAIDETILSAYAKRLEDDSVVVAIGRVQMDKYSGGLRLAVTRLMELSEARSQFGRYLLVSVKDRAPDVLGIAKANPPRKIVDNEGDYTIGLRVRLEVLRPTKEGGNAIAQVHLDDRTRFMPSNEAIVAYRKQAHQQKAEVVYRIV